MEREKEENLVKKTCKELGITQKELAEKTGFAVQTISRWNKSMKLPDNAVKHFHLIIEHERLKGLFIKKSLEVN